MITIEDRTSNKNLKIYRPDISLKEICLTKGPSIVRKMVPCFRDLPIEIINDTEEAKGNNHIRDPKCSFVYGVNVRTPRVKDILPFSTAYVYNKRAREGQLMDENWSVKGIKYKVPEFSDEFKIREILLRAVIQSNGTIDLFQSDGKIDEDKIKNNISILTLSSESKEALSETWQKKLKIAIAKPDGFLIRQALALKIRGDVYMWLTSEDYNVNTAGDALSNIIAISDDLDAISQHIMPHRLDFINLLFLIKARYLFDTEMAQRKTAIASAKAAIMSRNMSHNLGSHVMAYLKQHLNSVQDMVRDNVLASVFFSQDDFTDKNHDGLSKWYERFKQDVESYRDLSDVALPFLVGLGKFISYLQERQDFIATIATDYVPYFSTVNFKDFVYDELNPDLRYERHKDRMGLQPDNILLGNIARSEGLARITNPTRGKTLSDIVIKFRTFDGKPVVDSEGHPDVTIPNVETKIADLEEMRRLMVHLPGGVVGRQAIFSIIENVIRNAAKHGKWGESSEKRLELTFDYYTAEDIRRKKIATDYSPTGSPNGELNLYQYLLKYYSCACDINDLCIVTLTDNMSFEKCGTPYNKCERLDSIRRALTESYIDKNTVEMLQTNKGIKEMRISAAWLRGIEDDVKINPLYIKSDFDESKSPDPEDHWIHVFPPQHLKSEIGDHDGYKKEEAFLYKYWDKDRKHWVGKAPVLMVRASANNPQEDYHLQYILCLARPKDIAIVFSPETWEQWGAIQKGKARNATQELLSKSAWAVYSVQAFLNATNKSFEFIILEDKIGVQDENLIKRVSPNRVFRQKDVARIIHLNNDIIGGNKKSFTTAFVERVKTELFKKLCGFKPNADIITISDKKTMNRKLKNVPKNIKIVDGCSSAKFLYRTHNETELQFTAYLEASKGSPGLSFVEGITGNNSTDRLVRNDEINTLWLYKHLHAMKTTVGVFDERIFSKIYKKDESDIVLPSFEELQEECYNQFVDDAAFQDKILEAGSTKELLDLVGSGLWRRNGDYLAIAYARKGVGIFNMVKTEDGLDIYGYGGENRVVTNEKDIKYYASIVKTGEIRKVNGKIKITRFNNTGKFDYLSIHQGLLDKVYEQFDIRHDAYAKHQFTRSFYKAFCTDPHDIVYYDPMIVDKKDKKLPVFYLPQLRIHSGRSKPSFSDMPQHQPFMQYAAIEHAILDCKYSLIELLDFARYE